jgi:hypothetical protein
MSTNGIPVLKDRCEKCGPSLAIWRLGEPYCFYCNCHMPLVAVVMTEKERCRACSQGTNICSRMDDCKIAALAAERGER